MTKIYATAAVAKTQFTKQVKAGTIAPETHRIVEVAGGFQIVVIKLHREPSLQWRGATKKRGQVVNRVWAFFDGNSTLNRKDMLNAGVAAGFATNTLRTQYTQWVKTAA